MNFKLTEEHKALVLKRREEKVSQKAIAKEIGCSYSCIVHFLKRTNSMPSEMREVDAFIKAVEQLERHFPGAIKRIKDGDVEVVPTVKLKRY